MTHVPSDPATPRRRNRSALGLLSLVALAVVALMGWTIVHREFAEPALSGDLAQGRQIFRDETFGNERFWTDTAGLDRVVDKMRPIPALMLGIKVDLGRLNLLKFLLHNPFGASGTRELLRENAVVGVRATFGPDGHIARIGITCAFCHSTVDNALAPGIGHQLDGWPNRTLKVGKILATLRPFSPDQQAILRGWPAGTYDPRFNFDGKSNPLVLPPAYGLAGVRSVTYTAEGSISYWNAYVAVTQMHGHGDFVDPRLGVNIVADPDMVTSKLPALRAYQLSLIAPAPRSGGYDHAGADRGRLVFAANCVSCHVSGNLTDNNAGVLHAPSETGMDAAYALRTTQKQYRTTPLRGLLRHPPYFHDGSAATLADVVDRYVRARSLQLTAAQKQDLIDYLKTL